MAEKTDTLKKSQKSLIKKANQRIIEFLFCERAKKDYTESRTYWRGKKVGWIEKVQNWFYNVYLKSNGVSEGVRDYFGVVGMIMTMEKHMNPSFQSTTPCQN